MDTEHNVVNCAVVEWILLIVRLNVNFHRNRRQLFHTLTEKGTGGTETFDLELVIPIDSLNSKVRSA